MNSTQQQPLSSLLVITTSGGGGHLQAANAKITEERLKNPQTPIVIHDVLANAGGRGLGRFMINNIWDKAQRKGAVRALEFWAGVSPLFDLFFWIPVFFQVLHKLFKHHVHHVVDTQPLCLSPITYAVRIYNFAKNRSVHIEKILTELPTGYASHYLSPIKRLCRKNRQMIHLVTTRPLLEKHETDTHFWQEHCGLPLENISYAGFPIRPSFKTYQQQEKVTASLVLRITLKTPEEKLLMQDLFSRESEVAFFETSALVLTIAPADKVTTLMLGSQPVQKASLHYVQTFIDGVRESPNKTLRHYLFVFCSHKTLEDTPLQQKIHDLIMSSSYYPSNLFIIPMSSQTDDVIAPLYFRSDATLTKAGGITAMELMAVARGKIWIHHEDKVTLLEKLLLQTPLTKPFSYKGMPKWEYGNATYLEEMKGAQIVSPETFSKASKAYLSHQ